MPATPRSRDRSRSALTGLTAVAAAGVVSACGWMAGQAAHQHDQQLAAQKSAREAAAAKAQRQWQAGQQQRAAWEAAHATPAAPVVRTVWKRHPVRTVVDTRVVPLAPVGTGGIVSAASAHTGAVTSSATIAHAAAPVSTHTSRPATHTSTTTTHSTSTSGTSGSTGGSTASAPPPPPPPPPPVHVPSSGS